MPTSILFPSSTMCLSMHGYVDIFALLPICVSMSPCIFMFAHRYHTGNRYSVLIPRCILSSVYPSVREFIFVSLSLSLPSSLALSFSLSLPPHLLSQVADQCPVLRVEWEPEAKSMGGVLRASGRGCLAMRSRGIYNRVRIHSWSRRPN